jgi:hypothetical protein
MKYSIQETGEKVTPYKLFRYDEYAGIPNNAELEFWMKIQELETSLTNISTMPEYDQDDAYRLRDMAKRALVTA